MEYIADKKIFVEDYLSNAVSAATRWVSHLLFDDAEEIVTIVCDNGHEYHINVACDSHAAIIADVIQEVLRH